MFFELVGTAMVSFVFGVVVGWIAPKFIRKNNPDLPI